MRLRYGAWWRPIALPDGAVVPLSVRARLHAVKSATLTATSNQIMPARSMFFPLTDHKKSFYLRTLEASCADNKWADNKWQGLLSRLYRSGRHLSTVEISIPRAARRRAPGGLLARLILIILANVGRLFRLVDFLLRGSGVRCGRRNIGRSACASGIDSKCDLNLDVLPT
jgi:hypothetical protein